MKLPSIQHLLNALLKSIRTFPFTILSAILLTFLLFHTIDSDATKNSWMIRGLHASQLGIPFFIALTFLGQKLHFNQVKIYSIRITGLMLLGIYIMTLPEELGYIHFSRGVLLTILSILLPFLALCIKEKSNLDFWYHSQSIISTFIECLFYITVITLGISIALVATDVLFEINIEGEIYLKLCTFDFIFLNTIFFTSKIPSFTSPSKDKEYSLPLKNLVQFILLPLVCIYLIILYTYGSKILIAQNWPKGWVSYLSIGFSFLGILSLLIIYPIRNEKNLKWVHIFSKGFYYALFPVIILFSSAIYRRISEYGITEYRYYLIIIGVALFFIASYFLIKRQENIKVIPITLTVLTFISAFGPFSAFNISKKSQLNRLYKIGQKNNWINADDKWIKENQNFNEETNNAKSITRYIIDHHGYNSLQKLIPITLDSLVASEKESWKKKDLILYTMNLQNYYYDDTNKKEDFTVIDYYYKQDRLRNIKKYTYATSIELDNYSLNENSSKEYHFSNSEIIVSFKITNNNLNIGELTINNNTFTIPYTSFKNETYLTKKEFSNKQYKIFIKNISGTSSGQSTQVNQIKFDLYFNSL